MRRQVELARERVRNVLRVARLRPFETDTAEGRSLERYRRIVLSTAASIFARCLASAVSLVSVPIVIGYLGKEQYGFWAAVNAVTPWVAMFDLGIGTGLVNPISEAHGRDSHEDARAYFSTAFLALSGVALAVLAVLGVSLWFVPWSRVFAAPASLPPSTVSASVGLAFAFMAIGLPLATVPQVYAGYQKSYVGVLFPAVGAVLSLALLILAVNRDGGVVALFTATGGALTVGSLVALWWLVGREMPWLRPSPAWVSRRAFRRLLATSIPLYLYQLGALLVNQTQQIVLAQRTGLASVADYDLLLKLYIVISTLVTITTASVGPSLRESWERGEAAWMRRTFWHLMRLRMTLAAVAAAGLFFGGDLALRIWLRRPDFQYGPWTWGLLALLLVAAVWGATFVELLTNLDHIWPQVGVVMAQGLVTVALTWALARPLGTFGAVVAYAGPGIVVAGLFLPRMARRFLHPQRTTP